MIMDDRCSRLYNIAKAVGILVERPRYIWDEDTTEKTLCNKGAAGEIGFLSIVWDDFNRTQPNVSSNFYDR